jgi:predicted KAP-like P-loop ATPase
MLMWRDSESEQDFLNFTEIADQIATLATNPALLPISIGVFGTWGTGKSTVLKLVEALLPKPKDGDEETHNPIIVKFDAWMYQGFDDARTALMEVVASKLLTIAQEKKTLVEKAKEFPGRVNYFRGLAMVANFGIGMALGIPPGLLTRAGAAVSSAFAGNVTEDQYGELKKDAVEAKKGLTELINHAQTVPHYSAGYSSGCADFFEFNSGKDVIAVRDCSLTQCHLLHRPA